MTAYLSDDVARCVGRYGLKPDDPVCRRREQCARYQALLAHPRDVPIPMRISVAIALCTGEDDYMIQGEA